MDAGEVQCGCERGLGDEGAEQHDCRRVNIFPFREVVACTPESGRSTSASQLASQLSINLFQFLSFPVSH